MGTQERQIVLADISRDERLRSGQGRLMELADSVGVVVPPVEAERCVAHLLHVLDVNEYINLTRITGFEEALTLHILDSLLLGPFIPSQDACVLDMGTGAGFPGIPLAIACPQDTFTLLDSVGKKVKAVNAFVDVLGLENVETVHSRLEDYGRNHRAEFDVVVARALAPIGVLLEYARPLLKKGGTLLITKGTPDEDELSSAHETAKVLGYHDGVMHREIELPEGLGHRTILSFQAYRPSSVKLPRAIGMARKNPLA